MMDDVTVPDGGPADEVEYLDLGPTGGSQESSALGAGRAGRRPRWPLPLGLVVAAVVIAVLGSRAGGTPTASGTPRPSAGASSLGASSLGASSLGASSAGTSSAGTSSASAAAVAVTELGHPLLGASTGWELFGYGNEVVVRIEVARGRVTRTVVPGLNSGGPVAFVVGSHQVVVRPLDSVDGYRVPDGRPAQVLTGSLNLGGVVLPGPDLDHVWLATAGGAVPGVAGGGGGGRPGYSLTPLDGGLARRGFQLPAGDEMSVAADGAGGLLLTGVGGVYQARSDGLLRLTTGQLQAVGPTGWLVWECDDHHRCTTVLIDRASGARRVVGPGQPSTGSTGRISPDGAAAALIETDQSGSFSLDVLDLRTGGRHRIAVTMNQNDTPDDAVVWSPDGSLLIVADADGRLQLVDPHTYRVTAFAALAGTIPPVRHLAVRPVAGHG